MSAPTSLTSKKACGKSNSTNQSSQGHGTTGLCLHSTALHPISLRAISLHSARQVHAGRGTSSRFGSAWPSNHFRNHSFVSCDIHPTALHHTAHATPLHPTTPHPTSLHSFSPKPLCRWRLLHAANLLVFINNRCVSKSSGCSGEHATAFTQRRLEGQPLPFTPEEKGEQSEEEEL